MYISIYSIFKPNPHNNIVYCINDMLATSVPLSCPTLPTHLSHYLINSIIIHLVLYPEFIHDT